MTEVRPKYAIINDVDAPEPNMVVQLTAKGYCYLDRSHNKKRHDGMLGGSETTDVRKFGFSWAEDLDGMVRFYRNELEPTACYADGQPRRWQSRKLSFEWPIIKAEVRTK